MSSKPKKIVAERLLSFTMVLFVLVLGIGIGTLISNEVSAAGPAESQLQMQTAGKPAAGGAFLALSQAFEEVSNRIGPSVVNINTESPPDPESTGNNIFRFLPGPLQMPRRIPAPPSIRVSAPPVPTTQRTADRSLPLATCRRPVGV